MKQPKNPPAPPLDDDEVIVFKEKNADQLQKESDYSSIHLIALREMVQDPNLDAEQTIIELQEIIENWNEETFIMGEDPDHEPIYHRLVLYYQMKSENEYLKELIDRLQTELDSLRCASQLKKLKNNKPKI